MELKLKMPDQTNVTEQTDKSVESIPVPPTPQPVKSSSEILCELFGAFNATPPPLDDIKVPLEPVKKIHDKKQKKHSKKKSKKVKKKKSSSSSKSRSGSESRKKPKKSSSKHSTSDSESVNSKKKKKKKLGKYSASDSDSEEDAAPKSKKKKSSSEESSIKNCKETVKIKPEIDFHNTIPNLIQENVLKDTVSKIVDKVIDSTKLKKEPPDNDSGRVVSSKPILSTDNEPQVKVKQEPSSPAKEHQLTFKGNEAATSNDGPVLEENIPFPEVNEATDHPVGLPKDDKLTTAESDKSKPMMGKIKIQNLKFSQVYEATVKQIEEEAKRKAEKYEEGELSETTTEEKSPTPSLHSSSESVVEVTVDTSVPVPKKRKHRHHRKEKCHHSRKRSRSTERHISCHKRRRSNSQKTGGGEREINRSRSQERRRKRRISKDRSRSRSREKSNERSKDRKSSRSQERSRERRKDRRRSSMSRERSNERTRGRRKSRDRSRSHDRIKDRTKERRRSRERSKSTEKSKHSKKEKDRNNDRSNSQERNKDRTKERKKSKERASSKEKTKKIYKDKIPRGTDERIDKQKLLEIARKNALSMMKGTAGLVEQNKVVSITAGGKTVSELTDFCKLLSQKDAEGHESISSDTELSSGSESERPFHHPFQLKDRNAPIVLNIRNSVALPVKSLQEKTVEQARELRLQFPVSSGQHHRKTESEWVPVTKRPEPLAITAPPPPPPPVPPVRRKRTFTDTPDPPMIEWRETRRETLETIGQFTGSTGVRVLTQAELAAGQQAWARRDQLQVAAPVNSGMGMALLQKMGWRPGEGLGKNKEGALQPLLLEVKTDKKGLVAQEELPIRQPHQIIRRTQRSLEGKHPVSLLNEYCSRRKYSPPCFELIDEAGPDHKKNFRFKVKVNGVEYTPAVGSPKKKQARAEAAEVCLKEIGILPMMK